MDQLPQLKNRKYVEYVGASYDLLNLRSWDLQARQYELMFNTVPNEALVNNAKFLHPSQGFRCVLR